MEGRKAAEGSDSLALWWEGPCRVPAGRWQWRVPSRHPLVLGLQACTQHVGCRGLGMSWGWKKQLLANTTPPKHPQGAGDTSSARSQASSSSCDPSNCSRDGAGGATQCGHDAGHGRGRVWCVWGRKRRQTALPKGERVFINHLADGEGLSDGEELGDDEDPGDGEEPAVPGSGVPTQVGTMAQS